MFLKVLAALQFLKVLYEDLKGWLGRLKTIKQEKQTQELRELVFKAENSKTDEERREILRKLANLDRNTD